MTFVMQSLYEDIWRYAEMAINSGGQVVIQQEYSNATPDVIVTITNVDQLSDLKSKYDKIYLRLIKNG
jgi:hypothetical protein